MQDKEFNPRKLILPGLLVIGLIILTYWRSAHATQNYHIQGQTMGTSYNIKLANSTLTQTDIQSLHTEIKTQLKEINRQMSTWQKDSEISTFNNLPPNKKLKISDQFSDVLTEATWIAAKTKKAFLPHVLPLVELWGFGKPTPTDLPTPQAIKQALTQVHGTIKRHQTADTKSHWLSKDTQDLKLDLSGIAKGYAVDAIVKILSTKNIHNFFVEIGGELRTRGFNQKNKRWRIGIPIPTPNNYSERYTDLLITGYSVATSGDYRNFRLNDHGKRISHIIDPRTGYPVSHMLASVTVIATHCARADGLATGLFVMGHQAGLKLVETLENIEALFIYRQGDTFIHSASSGWTHFTSQEKLTSHTSPSSSPSSPHPASPSAP